MLATVEVTVELGSWGPNYQTPAELPPVLSNPCSVTYYESLTWFTGFSATARSDWTASGRVAFTPGTSLVQILYDDSVCDPFEIAYAYTEVAGAQKHIHYN